MSKRTPITVEISSVNVPELRKHFGGGRIATVVFTKKGDGSTRVLNGKTSVLRGLAGGEAAYNAEDYGQLRVFDVNAKDKTTGKRVGGYRTVTAKNVTEIRANGRIYKITDAVPEVSFIQGIAHDIKNLVLTVVLSGNVYRYFSVPRSVYVELIDASNKPAFFNENIRNKYDYLRVM